MVTRGHSAPLGSCFCSQTLDLAFSAEQDLVEVSAGWAEASMALTWGALAAIGPSRQEWPQKHGKGSHLPAL